MASAYAKLAMPTETEADRAHAAGLEAGRLGHPRDPRESSLAPSRSLRARALARLYLRAYNHGKQERLQRLYGPPPG